MRLGVVGLGLLGLTGAAGLVGTWAWGEGAQKATVDLRADAGAALSVVEGRLSARGLT